MGLERSKPIFWRPGLLGTRFLSRHGGTRTTSCPGHPDTARRKMAGNLPEEIQAEPPHHFWLNSFRCGTSKHGRTSGIA
jgi:hypothetical protein